jgi:hypothetical protein
MTHPEKIQAMHLLKVWKQDHKTAMELMAGLEIGMGRIHPENKVFQTVWYLMDSYTQTLQIAIGDKENWCQWYSAENDMGAKGLEAGYGGNIRPIKNLRDLLWLIAESQRRA